MILGTTVLLIPAERTALASSYTNFMGLDTKQVEPIIPVSSKIFHKQPSCLRKKLKSISFENSQALLSLVIRWDLLFSCIKVTRSRASVY